MNALLSQVYDIALGVRAWTEQEDLKRNTYPTDDLNGYCAIASAELSKRLTAVGIKHEIRMHNGDMGSHVFVVVDDHIVDCTATQFDEFANTTVVLLHERECSQYWFFQHDEVFNCTRQLRKHQSSAGWPKRQIAYS